MKREPNAGESLAPIVFCYDFPHRKSQMFLMQLMRLKIRPRLVIGAPRVELDLPPRPIRTTLYDSELEHPAELAAAAGAEYVRHEHTGDLLRNVLLETTNVVGLIAGARLLPVEVVNAFSVGVLNMHPTLLPGTRGIDSWLWDLYRGKPLGVTAHLIDGRIDCGRLVTSSLVSPRHDESLPEVWFRLLAAETRLIDEALKIVSRCEPTSLPELDRSIPLPGRIPDPILKRIAVKR